ncbi:MAG: NAD(P)H-dependent oxidoreductase [Wolinella sp.]
MKKVLVVSGHPSIKDSLANATILSELEKINGIKIRKLDELTNGYKFDIVAEQNALIDSEIVVFEFPFYWFSMPAILKKYFDDVFTYGFAHGSSGDKLHGKKVIFSFTTGAPLSVYEAGGASIEAYLSTFRGIAAYSGFSKVEFIYSGGANYIAGVSSESDRTHIINSAKDHAARLIAKINEI